MSDFSLLLQNISLIYKSSFDLFISNSEIQQILNGLLNYNKHLIESKKNIQTEHSASQFLIQKNLSIFYAMPLTMALELHFSIKINLEKILANSRLFLNTELRFSTMLRECSAIIYALSEY